MCTQSWGSVSIRFCVFDGGLCEAYHFPEAVFRCFPNHSFTSLPSSIHASFLFCSSPPSWSVTFSPNPPIAPGTRTFLSVNWPYTLITTQDCISRMFKPTIIKGDGRCDLESWLSSYISPSGVSLASFVLAFPIAVHKEKEIVPEYSLPLHLFHPALIQPTAG